MQTEAMVMRATGGPEVLERATIDLPEPGPREVRIRVRAVALNHIDIWARRGLPHFKYQFPHRLGADVAMEQLHLVLCRRPGRGGAPGHPWPATVSARSRGT